MGKFTCAHCGKNIDNQSVVVVSSATIRHGEVVVDSSRIDIYCWECSKTFGLNERDSKCIFVVKGDVPEHYVNRVVIAFMSMKYIPHCVKISEAYNEGRIIIGKANFGGNWVQYTYNDATGQLLIDDEKHGSYRNIIPFKG